MKVVAIIQARLGGKRLPGKVMLPLTDKSMLFHVIERVNRAKLVDEVVLAIPSKDKEMFMNSNCPIDHPIVVYGYPGDENDLVGRYYETAKFSKAAIIVRICADNPCVEPREIDRAISLKLSIGTPCFVSNMGDYKYSNYPDGIGCEVFGLGVLHGMNNKAKGIFREHPHLKFHETGSVVEPLCPIEFSGSDLKLDVNTQQDYEYIKNIYDNLYPKNPNFHITDIIEFLHEAHLV